LTITPWEVFADLGIAGLLLLTGQLLRSRLGVMQRLFLPASVIGGFLGLALGPNGANVLKLSEAFSLYPSILIALIFASLPLASERVDLKGASRQLTDMWSFSAVATLLQWGLGVLFTVVLLRQLWPDLNPGFGAVLASGFVGGHGTAAAVGETFLGLGWSEATSLAMTSATVGILSSIVGGMVLIKWGTASGKAGFITRFQDLPEELRTGLVREEARKGFGEETVSSNSIDTLAFHFCLICCAAVGGYFLSTWSGKVFPQFRLPVFCVAYVVALVLTGGLRATDAIRYVDRKTVGHLAGALTDILVVFGIASIKIAIVIKYALPLALLFVFGIALCAFIFFWMGPRFFETYWFEKSLFTWGWITGVTALGITLLRIVDSENGSRALNDFALAYLFVVPVEIALVAFAPQVIMTGHSWTLAGITIAAAAFISVLVRRVNRRV
jgi:ESS family glutamate:Na+ symporter